MMQQPSQNTANEDQMKEEAEAKTKKIRKLKDKHTHKMKELRDEIEELKEEH